MDKTLFIRFCDSCPFFQDEYDTCGKNEKEVPSGLKENGEQYLSPIPEWCPLEDVTNISPKLTD